MPKHSHDHKTGELAKKKFNKKNTYKMLIEATPQQRSLISEIVHQSGGGQPRAHYGGNPIPDELRVNMDPETHQYLQSIDHLPNHAHAREVFANKKAAGTMSEIGDVIINGAKSAWSYGKTAAKSAMEWGTEHSEQIGKAMQTGATVVSTVADVGGAIGLWGADVSTGMSDFSKGLSDFQQDKFKTAEQKKKHAEAKAAKAAKAAAAKKGEKKGSGGYTYRKYL